jgi:hypothetical protein
MSLRQTVLTQTLTQGSRHRIDSKQEDPWLAQGVRNGVRGMS